MILQEVPIYRNSQARCNLLSAQSLHQYLDRLYDHASPFTSADLGGIADPYLEEVRTWADSHDSESFSATRSRCRETYPLHNQLPHAEGIFYGPGYCPDRLDAIRLNHLDVGLMWRR
jgi:hypothetical protein